MRNVAGQRGYVSYRTGDTEHGRNPYYI